MPIDINKIRQFQEIDKQSVNRPALEIARQLSEFQMLKDQHLKSLVIGIDWREEHFKHLGGIREKFFSDLVLTGFRQKVAVGQTHHFSKKAVLMQKALFIGFIIQIRKFR